MKTFTQNARRSFIKNTIGIVGIALLPNIDIFAAKSQSSLVLGSIGFQSNKIDLLTNAFKKANFNNSFPAQNQKSDILFIGNLDNLTTTQIGNIIKSHSILVVDKSSDEAKMFELSSYCHYKRVHLAIIEKWAEGKDSFKVFEKMSFYETSVDEAKIHQSIQYLNILGKLTANNGFIIK